jgi:hypothetical protein
MPTITIGHQNTDELDVSHEDHGTGQPAVLIHPPNQTNGNQPTAGTIIMNTSSAFFSWVQMSDKHLCDEC